MIHLVLGGARSGKSSYAESQVLQCVSATGAAAESAKSCWYFATAQALDSEMQQRILHHQAQRQIDAIAWQTIECPLELTHALQSHATDDSVILVDCLTLWLSNQLFCENNDWQQVKSDFLQALAKLPGTVILVSNEVGCGIVPMGEISRRFVDEAGWLHQDIAAIADKVTLVTAGLPLHLKG
ncbi:MULTISPECIES: bifunctional adenosylcobinamide kinase/adenosylcobinamide-phosphate guanylyltransferase [unclassified Shewanella]|uniref:bifunctional adenosylcobinamide kinase/adenosylcobinamide-phosphate guanylyltransferase n=1 Tax=unclassified Shewanella TaxID=196818 RepID=UPI001BB8325B|nr:MULTISPECIES: bifunctional adenosylcobinamide kinase/adenosylcobinamide-phosphate guanylyltransferase [unclassified Shewanella]GIU05546.1 bifunctional adenosylcobinamide kinase/adenosylcobinamide-phosphate guanylyltransferase [Shewanella sp. MBTL60-112-B1]GIU23869.1 bifunctional adenosylcobinamide kinase/adenosylcobinamide-phosphate guanylyltransferase [Shewanella sp. MBTL60-112-B2]